MNTFKKDDKKIINAWTFYDWANSVYSLVVSSSVFPLFYGLLFAQREMRSWTVGSTEVPSESIISYLTAFGFIIISIISPVLSGVADYLGNKKFFLKLFCYLGATGCMLLYFFSLDYFYFSLSFYLMALLGFWGSLVFYNSYLPDIVSKENQDRVSAKGFGMGYIGSVLLLIILLVIIMKHELFGFQNTEQAMRFSFVAVGLWWIGFSQISYRYLPNFRNDKKFEMGILTNGLKELKKVYFQIKENAVISKYLQAFFVYNMAVQTIMIIAAYFGEKEIQWKDSNQRTIGLIISIMIIQLIAIIGAFLTSKLASKIGNFKTLIVINCIWIGICLYAYTILQPIQFYITAGCVGFVMGGIQSLSRSTFSKLLPKTEDTTSFFSFFDSTEKIGIVFGMSMYGLITQLTGKVQNAILLFAIFFIIGVILLVQTLRIEKKVKNKS